MILLLVMLDYDGLKNYKHFHLSYTSVYSQ